MNIFKCQCNVIRVGLSLTCIDIPILCDTANLYQYCFVPLKSVESLAFMIWASAPKLSWCKSFFIICKCISTRINELFKVNQNEFALTHTSVSQTYFHRYIDHEVSESVFQGPERVMEIFDRMMNKVCRD